MKDTYTYSIGKNLYINLTNCCTNRCAFCVRDQSAQYEGYSLWLRREPTVDEVIAEIGNAAEYEEVVFCGYGEPTYRLTELKEISAYVIKNGGRVRLNTNGHGNAINGRDITGELTFLNGVNISLNAASEKEYALLCRPQIENAYGEILRFAEGLKRAKVNCWFSVVDCIGEARVSACKKIAERVGIPLRVREMIENKK